MKILIILKWIYNNIFNLSEDEQEEMGLSDGLIRFSIGLDADIHRTYEMMKACMIKLNILEVELA